MDNLTNILTIKDLLNRHGFSFSKALGQNFLINPSVCPRMAEMCGADENTGVIEIGAGIGVLTADSPTGPWTDPIGKGLITRQVPNCANVLWLFDPAVLVDDDGTGYLYFGGGVPEGKAADPGNARVVKLGDDMISLAGDPVKVNAPYLFEDSGIHKYKDKYYYTYCSNWNVDAAGTAALVFHHPFLERTEEQDTNHITD